MAKKTLLVLVHPNLEKSRVNKALFEGIKDMVTICDLYKKYPDFKIDIKAEQKLLLEHDNIVFQFPYYWYQAPALLKEYLDKVLEMGFAFGYTADDFKLRGKNFKVAITTAAQEFSYFPSRGEPDQKSFDGVPYLAPEVQKTFGDNIINASLVPYAQMSHYIRANYIGAFITHAALPKNATPWAISDEELNKQCAKYKQMIKQLEI